MYLVVVVVVVVVAGVCVRVCVRVCVCVRGQRAGSMEGWFGVCLCKLSCDSYLKQVRILWRDIGERFQRHIEVKVATPKGKKHSKVGYPNIH
jgi:hypothetical protein